jgi:Cu2+-exporting ATPase
VKALVAVVPLRAQHRDTCLEFAAALEATSEHVIGRAIVAAAGLSHCTSVERLRCVPGSGVEGTHEGGRVVSERLHWSPSCTVRSCPGELGSLGDEVTPVLLGHERGWIALFTFAESVRPEAHRLVSELNARGNTTCLLSGDCSVRVQRLHVMWVSRLPAAMSRRRGTSISSERPKETAPSLR